MTTELDNLAKLDNGEGFHLFHYIVIDEHSVKEKCLPIRVYGGTVGGIWFDENKIIKKLIIDTNYVVKSYPENVNEIVQKYVGQKIKLVKITCIGGKRHGKNRRFIIQRKSKDNFFTKKTAIARK